LDREKNEVVELVQVANELEAAKLELHSKKRQGMFMYQDGTHQWCS
jgi:hypothetical protein